MKIRPWLFTLLFLSLAPSAQASLPRSHGEISEALLQEVKGYFPEKQEISPELLDFEVDPNLHLFQKARLRLTFIDEGAGYQNSFGYFLFEDGNRDQNISPEEVLQEVIIFDNASQEGEGGELRPGDWVELGEFPAGTRLGFFILADGFRDPKETFYTRDELNPDGKRHLAMLAAPDRESVVLGIEDLPWESSDHDFNDILFTVNADPPSALREAIEDGHIPVAGGPAATKPDQNPEPSQDSAPIQTATAPSVPAHLEGGGLGCQMGKGVSFPGIRLVYWILTGWVVSRFLCRTRLD